MLNVSVLHKKYFIEDFKKFLKHPVRVKLSPQVKKSIKDSHKNFMELQKKNVKIYGVNTGFGKLSQVSIDIKDQKQLQLNLIRSHAAGIGRPIDFGLVRIIMFLKLLTYAKGVSGIRKAVADQLVEFLNHDLLPVIPRKSSVGASGDLAPMAHMALALIGEGEVHFQDRIIPSMLALKEIGLEPLKLHPKEGLSLINGTQVSTAFAIKAMNAAKNLFLTADIIGALSVETSLSSRNVFKANIHKLKDHKGQQLVAKNIWNLLRNSEIVASHNNCERVQDPYSIRCIPQIHGASRQSFQNSKQMIEQEINSVSDNPLILPDGSVHSSGHFHAEFVAQAMDTLAIAISEIGAISERRINFFMKGIEPSIPPFVVSKPGIESGCMIVHVTATALASENKTLAHPASVDSISTSAGQEDIVSMAPWAGRKALRIIENVTHILAAELLVAARASILFHKKLNPGIGTKSVLNLLKRHIKMQQGDHPYSKDLKVIAELIRSGKIVKSVLKNVSIK
ncbi:MAG: histidine ammonia-lyase [Candidatus Marinimicrobia bacterium]|nr:histidine ammonia-lyase [Candidatus Neomarinimicrobiota bacterium]